MGGPRRGHRRRAHRADHVHEQLGRHQGVRRPPRRRRVHVDQRPRGARVGARGRSRDQRGPGRQGAVLPRSAPGPQHRRGHGLRARRHARVGPPQGPGRAHRARRQGGHVPAVAGPLLDPPAVPARPDRRLPGRAPRRHRGRAPRGARTRPSSSPTRSGRPTTSSGPSPTRRPDRRSRSGPRSTSSTGWPRSTPTRRSCRSTR